jgi:hypothetical protein
MCGARALGRLEGCSEEASWDETSPGACEHVCQGSEAKRGRLGSNRGLEEQPEGSRKAQGDQMGSAECVCDMYSMWATQEVKLIRVLLDNGGLQSL